MEPEVSLLCLQESAICHYPEPGNSSPRLPIFFYKTRSSIMFPYTRQCLSFRFPHMNAVCISFFPTYVAHIPRPSHNPCFDYHSKVYMKLMQFKLFSDA